jgi:DNA topoisomerase-2
LIFHIDDDPLLKYLDDDGLSIEPEWYCPIIPMCLVNGADGIGFIEIIIFFFSLKNNLCLGTGWSTKVPCYNPLDLIRNIKRFIHSFILLFSLLI